MVAAPADYAWSSFHRNANLVEDSLVRPHPIYMALGEDAEERASAYRDFVRDAAPEEESDCICSANTLWVRRDFESSSRRSWGGARGLRRLGGLRRTSCQVVGEVYSDPGFASGDSMG